MISIIKGVGYMPTINYYWLQHADKLEEPSTAAIILAVIATLIIVGTAIYVAVKL